MKKPLRSLGWALVCVLVSAGCAAPRARGDRPLPVAGSVSVPASPTTSATPSASPLASDDAPLPLWPAVRSGVLPNGVSYFILKNGHPDKRALFWLAVDVGSAVEDDDEQGFAHFVEHMAFSGTRHFPRAALIDYLEKNGMRLGADFNALTSTDETLYQLTIPTDGPTGSTDRALEILRDWAGDVSYDPAQVDRERGVVLEEERLGSGAVAQAAYDELLAGSRYAHTPAGNAALLRSVTRTRLYHFYRRWYRPELMSVVVVGDVDPPAIERAIQQRFADLPPTSNPEPVPRGKLPAKNTDGTRVVLRSAPYWSDQSVRVYSLYRPRPLSSRGSTRRALVESLYSYLLTQRLASLARESDAPFTGASAETAKLGRNVGAFCLSVSTKSDRTVESAIAALVGAVTRVEQLGFTAVELERACVMMGAQLRNIGNSSPTIESGEYAAEIVRYHLEHEAMIGRGPETRVALDQLATVTLDELNQVARRFDHPERRVVVLTGPSHDQLLDAPRVRAIVAQAEHATYRPWIETAPATPLFQHPPTAGRIVSERKIDSVGVTEWRLSNGARVVVKPTDFEADAVTLSALSPGGLSMASDRDFVSARFAAWASNGTGDYSAAALQTLLAGTSANVSPDVGPETSSVSGQAVSRDLGTLLQLVYLAMTAPRRDPQAWALWRSNAAQRLTDSLRDHQITFVNQSNAALFGQARRALTLTADDARRADLDVALAFYRARFTDAANFTFVIVGAVDLPTLRPLVETYLASLPSRTRHHDALRDVHIRKVPGVVVKKWALGTARQAGLRLDFHGDDQWSSHGAYDVDILRRLVWLRLFDRLRAQLGNVYSFSVTGSLERTPHPQRDFSVELGCAPENLEAVAAAVLAELERLTVEPVSDGELGKVRETYLRERQTALQKNNTWLTELAEAYRFGDDPAKITDSPGYLSRISAANIQAAAQHFLDRRQYFRADLLPSHEAARESWRLPAQKPVPSLTLTPPPFKIEWKKRAAQKTAP